MDQVIAFTQPDDGFTIDDRIIATWLRGGPVPPGFDSSQAFIVSRVTVLFADMKKVAVSDPKGLVGFLSDAPLSFERTERDEAEGERMSAFYNTAEHALNSSKLLKRYPLLRGLAERMIHADCTAEASENLIGEGHDRFTNFMGGKELAAAGKMMRLIRSPSKLGALNKTEVDDAREAIFAVLSFMSAMGSVAKQCSHHLMGSKKDLEATPHSTRSFLRLLEALGDIPQVAIGNSPIIIAGLALFAHEDKAFARQVKILIVPLKVLSVFALVVVALKKREPLQPS